MLRIAPLSHPIPEEIEGSCAVITRGERDDLQYAVEHQVEMIVMGRVMQCPEHFECECVERWKCRLEELQVKLTEMFEEEQ